MGRVNLPKNHGVKKIFQLYQNHMILLFKSFKFLTLYVGILYHDLKKKKLERFLRIFGQPMHCTGQDVRCRHLCM